MLPTIHVTYIHIVSKISLYYMGHFVLEILLLDGENRLELAISLLDKNIRTKPLDTRL